MYSVCTLYSTPRDPAEIFGGRNFLFIFAVVMNKVEVALFSGIDVIPWRDLHLQVSRTVYRI